MTKSTGQDWLGVPALAKELGVTIRTLYRMLNSGELPSYKIGRVIRIKRADINAFREQSRVMPEDRAHSPPTRRAW